MRGRKELRNSKISRKSSLKKWISGHQSLQRDLREPLVRVRLTYGIIHSIGTNASTLSSLENAFMRSIVKKWLVRSVLVHSAYILNVQNHKNGCNFFLGCAHEIPSRLKRSRFQMFRRPSGSRVLESFQWFPDRLPKKHNRKYSPTKFVCFEGFRVRLSFSKALIDVPNQSTAFRAHFWCFSAGCPNLTVLGSACALKISVIGWILALFSIFLLWVRLHRSFPVIWNKQTQ